MTDTERLDKLERFVSGDNIDGVCIMEIFDWGLKKKSLYLNLVDVGQVGTDLIGAKDSLRDLIDALP